MGRKLLNGVMQTDEDYINKREIIGVSVALLFAVKVVFGLMRGEVKAQGNIYIEISASFAS